MSAATFHYLLVYNLHERSLIEQHEFSDSAEAVREYQVREKQYLDRKDHFEVVLVGADSIETVMQTHGSYFDGTATRVTTLLEDLEELLKLQADLNAKLNDFR